MNGDASFCSFIAGEPMSKTAFKSESCSKRGVFHLFIYFVCVCLSFKKKKVNESTGTERNCIYTQVLMISGLNFHFLHNFKLV